MYNDMIDLKNNGTFYQYYNNTDEQKNYGVELEYSKKFQNRSKLLLNGSYSEFLYKNTMLNNLDINTPIVSKATGNLGYIYPISSNTTLSGTAKYYGTKALYENNKIDSVVLCNLSLEYLLSKNAKISFGGKNIFDTKYYYYGYATTDEKMLREGANWTLDLSYEF
jgi:iron complex outermembrane receptor protein